MSKKSNKIFKVLCITFAVIIISCNAFAVAVADNDGSAFISKAEFDSLKNNFQAQIDNFYSSIDNKIDTSIASYLAGIRVERIEKLTNIYQNLGGSAIKFGKPNIDPTVNPVTGLALFFQNGDNRGYSVMDLFAKRAAIMGDNRANFWSSSGGGGTKGKFIKYINDGNKYLESYEVGSVEACYSGAWWTGKSTTVPSTQTYPFGNGGQELGAAITLPSSTRTNVDSYVSIYREYKESELMLDWWTSSGAIDTTANKVFLSTDNYKKVNARKRTVTDQSGYTTSGGTSRNITIKNIDVYSWNTETSRKYDQLTPGFYYGTQYKNTLFGGVQLCSTAKYGKVKIEKLSFNRYSNNAIESTGSVYVAISDEPFSNQDDFYGNVKLISNSLSDESTEYKTSDGKKFKYKLPSRKEMTVEFECNTNKTYYIKCQYDTTITKDNKKYVTISNGAQITGTWE